MVCGSVDSVICGKLRLSFSRLFRFAEIIEQFKFYAHLASGRSARALLSFIAAERMRIDWRENGHAQVSFLHLLRTGRERDATDPRDKIYFIHGLCHSWVLPYTPTYALDAATLYRDVAEHIISTSGNLEILSYCHLDPENLENLSSLAPDWNVAKRQPNPLNYAVSQFHASGSTTRAADFEVYGTILKVHAHLLESVDSMTEPPPDIDDAAALGHISESRDQLYQAMTTFFATCESLAEKSYLYRMEKDRWSAFARTLLLDRKSSAERIKPEYIEVIRQAIAVTRELARDYSGGSVGEDDMEGIAKFPNVLVAFGLASSIRKFCLFDKGRIGWVPLAAEKGDVCSIVCGSDVPLLLRPSGPSTYVVVGECYVHGVMDGEVVKANNEERQMIKLI
jgi:hypothetical protein